jgi:hypothetical protein
MVPLMSGILNRFFLACSVPCGWPRDLVGLAQASAHVAALIPTTTSGGEREPAATLHDLGDPVDEDDAVDQLAHFS